MDKGQIIMITEVLGIIIAFMTTMLLFSLFITTVVQAFNFRDFIKYLYMKKGMTRLAEYLSVKSTDNLVHQAEIFNSINDVIGRVIAYDRKAYISFEEIYSAFQSANPQTNIGEGDIKRWFELVEDEQSRCLNSLRMLSLLLLRQY